jgi:hypothetical protein
VRSIRPAMDMTLRSFVFAGAVLAVLAAGLAGWWLFDRFGPGLSGAALQNDRVAVGGAYDDQEGSIRDEFGGSTGGFDDRVTITNGEGLFADDIFDQEQDERPASTRFGSGPRFDWSGSGSGLGPSGADAASLARDTAADRVEADCRIRGGGSYACRCLVRLARRDLSEAEFEFLSLAEESEPRSERLNRSGLALTALAGLSARLVALDAESRRRCGAGLTP